MDAVRVLHFVSTCMVLTNAALQVKKVSPLGIADATAGDYAAPDAAETLTLTSGAALHRRNARRVSANTDENANAMLFSFKID